MHFVCNFVVFCSYIFVAFLSLSRTWIESEIRGWIGGVALLGGNLRASVVSWFRYCAQHCHCILDSALISSRLYFPCRLPCCPLDSCCTFVIAWLAPTAWFNVPSHCLFLVINFLPCLATLPCCSSGVFSRLQSVISLSIVIPLSFPCNCLTLIHAISQG